MKEKYGRPALNNQTVIRTYESLRSGEKIEKDNKDKKTSIFQKIENSKARNVSYAELPTSNKSINFSGEKTTTSNSFHQKFGSAAKSSTFLTLTSPKMRSPLATQRLNSLHEKEKKIKNGKTEGNHNKSKTMVNFIKK